MSAAVVVVTVGVEQSIILAIVSLILHVRRQYLPRDRVLSWDARGRFGTRPPVPGAISEPGLVIYRFGVGLFYANAQRFSDEVLGLVDVPDPPRWFVLDAEAIDDIDYTGGLTLAELADAIRLELDRFGLVDKIGEHRLFDSLHAAREAFHAA